MSAPSPRVSAVVITYNRAPVLGEALESIRAQTMPDLELLVVDDGSTDDTPELLRALGEREPRLRVIRQENAGCGVARNTGLEAARAPFLAFLDSDDLWEPECLALFEAHPETDASLCDGRFVGPWNQPAVTLFSLDSWRPPTSLAAMFDFAYALPSCMCIRTPVLQALRYDEALPRSSDTEILFRFHLGGHVLRQLPAVLTQYRKLEVEGAAPQMVADGVALHRTHLEILGRYAEHAPDPGVTRRRLARRWGLTYAREGRWRAARPHLREWWRRQPRSMRALRLYLRSLLARGDAG